MHDMHACMAKTACIVVWKLIAEYHEDACIQGGKASREPYLYKFF